MKAILFLLGIYAMFKILSALSAKKEKERQQTEIDRIIAESRYRSLEIERTKEQAKTRQAMIKAEAKRAETIAKEQIKQAEKIRKAEEKLHAAEAEEAFCREQINRLFKLLDIAELERDSLISGTTEWKKRQKEVISLDNQIHTLQKRLDKAMMDDRFIRKTFLPDVVNTDISWNT